MPIRATPFRPHPEDGQRFGWDQRHTHQLKWQSFELGVWTWDFYRCLLRGKANYSISSNPRFF
jgi:hypothetical protein